MMTVDQLILSLSQLGFIKYVHPEKLPVGITPVLDSVGQDSFVVWENQENFGEGGDEITLVDLLFDIEGPYGGGRVTFIADEDGELMGTKFYSHQNGVEAETIRDDAIMEFKTIHDIAWFIKKFKSSYTQLQDSLNEN
tara:strand:- start:160 stop:573 length:414 start_codon:yes stop_codon:yes gene_type:complete